MGPQDPPNRPRSPEDINGPKLPGLPWEFDNFLEAWRFGVFWGSEGTLEKGSWGSKSIGYQAFYRFKCVFGGPTQPISQIASAQIPLFIGFGASAPIGFLKQGAQLQDPIHSFLEAYFTKAQ